MISGMTLNQQNIISILCMTILYEAVYVWTDHPSNTKTVIITLPRVMISCLGISIVYPILLFVISKLHRYKFLKPITFVLFFGLKISFISTFGSSYEFFYFIWPFYLRKYFLYLREKFGVLLLSVKLVEITLSLLALLGIVLLEQWLLCPYVIYAVLQMKKENK